MPSPTDESRPPHLSEEELALLGEGRLRGDPGEDARRHLARCRTCMAAYADVVRYRAAWLANPDLFEDDERMGREGLRLAPAREAPAGAPRGAAPSFSRRSRWSLAALSAAAAVIAVVLLVPRKPPPLVTHLPPALAAALESEASRSLVLPGGEAGAARDPTRFRGADHRDPLPLRRAVDSCLHRYESGEPSAHLAYVVGAGSLALGQLDLARDYVNEARARNPGDPTLLALAADIRLRSDDVPRAEELLREALRRRPREPVLVLDLAIVLREKGEHGEARRLLESLVAGGGHPALVERARRLLAGSAAER